MVDSVREQLLASHEEFRRLAQEHSHHCDRLHTLIEKRYLTEDEKLEEVRIKKLKLHLKDQMYVIEQEYKRAQTQVA
ncbi:MAG TPA: YdcH family protein [Candidatus Angelobacter sp.]|nr:YdcH family protein [Candidatus Angelobacter sp.]